MAHSTESRTKRVLYVTQEPRIGERAELSAERDMVLRTVEHPRRRVEVVVDVLEGADRVELHRAAMSRSYSVVAISGHGWGLGIAKGAGRLGREQGAAALAELLAVSCCPNASILLLGCNTGLVTAAFSSRGLRGAAFDGPVLGGEIRAFLEGYLVGLASGREGRTAFEAACLSLAFESIDAVALARWFAPELDPGQGRYDWVREPPVGRSWSGEASR
ncbi:MAG: hypothetical protein KC501_29120 [Myxococcales bacterium]|nr:hypothetical protein [Myxococcales bacterium]